MIIIMLILFGLSFGSFVNALVWRFRKQEMAKSKKDANKYSISNGRSMCSSCKHVLSPLDLVPVFSWLFLRGRCRYCKKAIQDTPLPEIALPVAFVVSYIFWPFDLMFDGAVMNWAIFVSWLATLIILMALALYDLKWQLLPTKLVYIAGGFGSLFALSRLASDFSSTNAIALAASTIIGGGFFWVLFQISQGRWIGGGDVRLGFVLGLLLGSPLYVFLMIFIASLLGTVVALPYVVKVGMKRTPQIPFGPYLILATIIVFLYGRILVSWYVSSLGM